MWLTIIAAAFFAVILIVTMMRAEKSAANGALIVITLLAVGIAAIAMMRSASVGSANDAGRSRLSLQPTTGLPALSCLDGLAGENVESACEKAVFASADSTAAAVSYAASQVTRLASYGNVAAADKVMTPELQALRRAIERDRYGLIAQVLTARDGCNLSVCPFFQSLTNTAQISINMTEKAYEGFVGQYLPLWNAPPAPATTSALAPNVPSGKPLTGDFPASSASIPPVNIMSPEPPLQPQQTAPKTAEDASAPRAGAAKKPPAQKPRAQAPASLAPPPASDDN